MGNKLSRRKFLKTTTAAGIGLTVGSGVRAAGEKPALLGGKPVRTEPIPSWPIFDQSEEQALLATVRTGNWFRGSGKKVAEFEAAYAKLNGAKFCIGTSSGTNALIMSLNALGVGAGDEVILPPYTFVACVNAILMLGAIPIFADVDRETFQIDPAKVEAAMTDRTAAIMPVHIGGNPVNLDALLAIARKHQVALVEDACQAHLAEWRGAKVGTFGDTGCFSFQASKNLTAGEGGAILTQREELADRCFAAQTNSRSRKGGNIIRGANVRMSEFHAALLLAQMTRLPEQASTRDGNGAYLTSLFEKIPGIIPARAYEGATRNAYHLFMFRYDKEAFAKLPRAKFIAALAAEGVQVSGGYTPLNRQSFLVETLRSRGYSRVFPKEKLGQWVERSICPEADRLSEEAMWFSQHLLLAKRQAMDQIAEAVRKIQAHASELARA